MRERKKEREKERERERERESGRVEEKENMQNTRIFKFLLCKTTNMTTNGALQCKLRDLSNWCVSESEFVLFLV